MDNICVYCVVGVEYNMNRVPSKISILGSFTDCNKAIAFRGKQKGYTVIDIIETIVDNEKCNADVEHEMDL